jgi:hypothetical protein
MIKTFSFQEKPNISPLSWCIRYKKTDQTVFCIHGSWVECGEHHFVEGAWSGNYDDALFADAMTFTGSGGIITDQGLVLATSTNTLFPIYVLTKEALLYVSNSLPFLLSATNDDVDIHYPYYDSDMMNIRKGLNTTIQIPTQGGQAVHLYFHCNLLVNHLGTLQKYSKKLARPFSDYSDYYSFLSSQVSEVASNAAHCSRAKIKYSPLATISSGYDSPACAVLGKNAGCKRALTFTTAAMRNDAPPVSDSGREIGELLGIEVKEYDPMDYIKRDDYPEADFMATGVEGADMIFSSVDAELPEKILLVGMLGDSVWDRIDQGLGTQIVRHDAAGVSLSEFRLRIGFLCLPIPFIGCTQHPSIFNITNSKEMAKWSIENSSYDRPIPRRIAEEAGIPRECFGQRKKVVARPHISIGWRDPLLEKVMSRHSLADFHNFMKDINWPGGIATRSSLYMMRMLYYINYRLISSVKLRKACEYVGISLPLEPIIPFRYKKPRSMNSFTFHWGIRRTMKKYLIFE